MEVNGVRQIYQLDSKNILEKLQVLYNSHSSMVVFWNKYQIFVYENFNFTECTFSFQPEFKTQSIILSNNYFICLGFDGQIHLTSLKFKSPGPKRFKRSFEAQQEGIVAWAQYDYDYCFTIKLESNSEWNLCYHRITSDFQVCHKSYLQIYPTQASVHELQKKVILKCHAVTEKSYEYLRHVYKLETIDDKYSLVIICYDRIVVYCCLFNRMTLEALGLIELYSCPTEINDILILETDIINILIGLKTGSFIRLPFSVEQNKPQIIHFNIPINKFVAFDNSLFYTDGKMLWKSLNTYSENDRKLTQLNVKIPMDFTKVGDQIICITFCDQIHIFSVDDQSLDMNQVKSVEYENACNVLSKTKQFEKINEVLIKNDHVCKDLYVERDYLISMVLANREDIVRRLVTYIVKVYENYEDVMVENKDAHLTNEVHEYFETNCELFLIKVVIAEKNTLNHFILCLLENLKLHVTLLSHGRILRTATVAIKDIMRTMNILINLRNKSVTNVKMQIKLIPVIPGALDANQKLFISMSKKYVKLNSEHFIRVTKPLPKSIVFLQNMKNKAEESVLKLSRSINVTLFSFTNLTNRRKYTTSDCSFYVKLSDQYVEQFNNEVNYKNTFSKVKADFIMNKLSSDDFLNSRNPVIFQVQSEKVKIQIKIGDDSRQMIRVTSRNLKIAHDIKEFLSSIMYRREDDQDFVEQAQYSVVEDLERTLRSSIAGSSTSEDVILELAEQFKDNIIGDLPV